MFSDFISTYQKSFLTKAEFTARLSNFKASLEEVRKINAEPGNTFKLELNQFADLTQEEYQKKVGLKNLLDPEDAEYFQREFSIPFD